MKNKKKIREILGRYEAYIEYISDKIDPESVMTLKAYGYEIEQYVEKKTPIKYPIITKYVPHK